MPPSRKRDRLRLPVATAPVTTAGAPPATPRPMTPAAPAAATPAPATPAPSPATPAAPAHLFGRKTIRLVAGRNRRTRLGVSRRRPAIRGKRLRREGCGLSARGQRRRARGKSKGEFQKVAAFHDISLVAAI
jgi:hypothetical protein